MLLALFLGDHLGNAIVECGGANLWPLGEIYNTKHKHHHKTQGPMGDGVTHKQRSRGKSLAARYCVVANHEKSRISNEHQYITTALYAKGAACAGCLSSHRNTHTQTISSH